MPSDRSPAKRVRARCCLRYAQKITFLNINNKTTFNRRTYGFCVKHTDFIVTDSLFSKIKTEAVHGRILYTDAHRKRRVPDRPVRAFRLHRINIITYSIVEHFTVNSGGHFVHRCIESSDGNFVTVRTRRIWWCLFGFGYERGGGYVFKIYFFLSPLKNAVCLRTREMYFFINPSMIINSFQAVVSTILRWFLIPNSAAAR